MVTVDGQIKPPQDNAVRLVSFNINGYKTLTHYHPWNQLSTLQNIFTFLNADIITFQELKLQKQDIDRQIVSVPGYHSFITIPKTKRGYSGTAVFVKNSLNVVKVEQGISGYLDVSSDPGITYRKIWDRIGNDSLAIGGYTDNIVDWREGETLDADGRCVIVELDNGVVIISVYCPANSMAVEEEEVNRCLFLSTLFQRVENLEKMGKHVVLMGDINVAPSLIDRDDAINELVKSGEVKVTSNFEHDNISKVLQFRSETQSRQILHDYLYDYQNLQPEKNVGKVFYDLTRKNHLNRLKMYTCWNTLLNNRPMNIGSRIDLFLATKKIEESVVDTDIWSFLYGSDHCPIYCDIDMSKFSVVTKIKRIKHFEAISYYGLGVTKSIDSFFKSSNPKSAPMKDSTSAIPTPTSKRPSTTSLYNSRKMPKGQTTLSALVKEREKANEEKVTCSLFVDSDAEEKEQEDDGAAPTPPTSKKLISAAVFKDLLNVSNFETTPRCSHSEPCVLRTTKNGPNTGKKFWCCARRGPNNDTWSQDNTSSTTNNSSEVRCNFFKWAQK